MGTYTGTKGAHQARARAAEAKEYATRLKRGWTTRQSHLFAQARGLAFTDKIDWDGERLPNVSGHTSKLSQNQGGRAKDVANAVALGEAVNAAIKVAGPTQRRLLLTALDGAAPEMRKATAMARQGRLNRLHGLRKSVRTMIEHRHGKSGIGSDVAQGWLDTLTKLQAEIAFYQDQKDAHWHVPEIARVLPDYCAHIGEQAIRSGLDAFVGWLDDLYGLAARYAVDQGVMIDLPTLITSAEIGERHRISHVETRFVFPKGKHGIRAYDSTYTPSKRRTVEQAQGDAAYIREKDELARFHGVSRHTVNRWARNPEKYADKLAEMRTPREEATAPASTEPVTPVTPQTVDCPGFLIENYKEVRDTCGDSVTNDNDDLSRNPDFLRDLAAWKCVKVSSLRVYRKRGKLAALIAAYLDHLDDLDAIEACAAMAGAA